MNISEMCKKSHETALQKGWWADGRGMAETVMMIVVELSEAIQEHRKHGEINDKFKEEIADVFIRLADLCESYNINIEEEIERKMAINEKRPYKHNKKY
jgi:NTP pyrophosphatase (non-canonical NTP hydrolase)